FQIQAGRLLYHFSLPHLTKGVSNLRQTPVLLQIARVLASEQALRLAITSDKPHVQFAALYRSLVDDRRSHCLSVAATELLTELLLRLAIDAAAWANWMKAFVGYQALQVPLGRALATVPDAALDGYIDSIGLFPRMIKQNTSRVMVAECLRAFNASA